MLDEIGQMYFNSQGLGVLLGINMVKEGRWRDHLSSLKKIYISCSSWPSLLLWSSSNEQFQSPLYSGTWWALEVQRY